MTINAAAVMAAAESENVMEIPHNSGYCMVWYCRDRDEFRVSFPGTHSVGFGDFRQVVTWLGDLATRQDWD